MDNFFKEHYDEFLTIEDAPIEDALSEEEVKYYISECFEEIQDIKRGDVVYVKTYAYEDGYIGKNHLFVIINENEFVPFEYFGMIISSNLKKFSYPYNIELKKDNKNNLHKNSLVKTDYVFKLKGDDISYIVGKLDERIIRTFEIKHEEYLNEKS